MKNPKQKLRVGVTLGAKHKGQAPWEWDLWQSSIYLVQLLNQSPQVERAVLIDSGKYTDPMGINLENEVGVEVISPDEAKRTQDVVIELGFGLPDQWITDFRSGGGKYVGMKVSNESFLDIEDALFGQRHEPTFESSEYDALWILPGLEASCSDYLGITSRAPVQVVPSIWSPYFLKRQIAELPANTHYGYVAGRQSWRICSFDPSTTISHSLLVPLLICEEANRLQPRLLERVHMANSFRFLDQTYFNNFKSRLHIVLCDMVNFDGRRSMHDCISSQGDCNILHQSEGGQSYRLYESLYGRYPLIHNFPLLRDYGYYYEGFDCQRGAHVLLDAIARHDRNLVSYEANCTELLERVDISHPENIKAYTQELMRLFA